MSYYLNFFFKKSQSFLSSKVKSLNFFKNNKNNFLILKKFFYTKVFEKQHIKIPFSQQRS